MFNSTIYAENEANAYFEKTLISGDINGDGYDDLIVTVLGKDTLVIDQGEVYVYLGSYFGLSSTYTYKISA